MYCFKPILRFKIRALLKQGGWVAAFLALKTRLSVKSDILCPNCTKRRGARGVGGGHRFRTKKIVFFGALPIKFNEHQTSE